MSIPGTQDLLDFSGRSVVVTGASQGIGAGIARRFGEAGARVIVHYRSDSKAAEKVVAAINAGNGQAEALHAELNSEAGSQFLVEQTVARYGGLDVLVNNAGSFPLSPLLDMKLDDWRAMYSANVETTMLCTRAAATYMQSTGGGAIVNMASISALNPGAEHSHYNSAKAAVLMFTRSAAQELGKFNIRVNCVSPGLIARPGLEAAWPEGVARWESKVPLGRLGEAEDVADACLFLASPAARWVTGHNLVLDGGMLSSVIY